MTMNTTSLEDVLMEYSAYRHHRNLMLYAPPVLLFLGTVGNALSVIILTQKMMRNQSTYLYLAVLSGADTAVLYIGLLRLWLGEITGEDFRDHSDWSCRIISLLGYTISDFSGWLIIVVTIERYLVVYYPLKASTITSQHKAIKVVLGMFVALLIINCHFLWTVRIVHMKHDDHQMPQCSSIEPYITLIDDIWPWIDAFIYSFIPFIIILVLNTLIIQKVMKARKQRQGMHCAGRRASTCNNEWHQYEGKITVMLLTVSFTFLVTTVPLNLSLIITKFLIKTPRSVEMLVGLRLLMTITELLMYVNHSINFILYCATGQRFREELFRVLARRKPLVYSIPATECVSRKLCQMELNDIEKQETGRLSTEATCL